MDLGRILSNLLLLSLALTYCCLLVLDFGLNVKYSTLILRIQCELPVSSAVASTEVLASILVLHSVWRFDKLPYPYSHNTDSDVVRAAARLPQADIFLGCFTYFHIA